MRINGKKMFPGKTYSNIFFVERKNPLNINPNKFVINNHKYIDNKPDNKNINKSSYEKTFFINKESVKNLLKIKNNSTESIKENRIRNKSSEIHKLNGLKNNYNSRFKKDNQINQRKVLFTERSVDCLNTKRVLGNFSVRNYFLNINNIWNKNKTIDISDNSKEFKPLNGFSKKEIDYNKISKTHRKSSPNKFYDRFVNKKSSQDKIILNTKKIKKRQKDNIPPKERTFIIEKIQQDNNLIDLNELRKKVVENGINIISLTGLNCFLDPIHKDSAKIILNNEDIKSKKFNIIEKYIKNKGLKLNEVKNNYNIKYTRGIFPNKTSWNDLTYGGREKFEKLEISSRYNKEKSEGKFHKKNILSKTNYYKGVKYKNNFEIKPKRYKNVEK